jgi:hypothetical protein
VRKNGKFCKPFQFFFNDLKMRLVIPSWGKAVSSPAAEILIAILPCGVKAREIPFAHLYSMDQATLGWNITVEPKGLCFFFDLLNIHCGVTAEPF